MFVQFLLDLGFQISDDVNELVRSERHNKTNLPRLHRNSAELSRSDATGRHTSKKKKIKVGI